MAGADRYDTSVLLGKYHAPDKANAVVASGVAWPDALAGATLAGARKAPLLLTTPGELYSVVVSFCSATVRPRS